MYHDPENAAVFFLPTDLAQFKSVVHLSLGELLEEGLKNTHNIFRGSPKNQFQETIL
jgi:hypothetical protein